MKALNYITLWFLCILYYIQDIEDPVLALTTPTLFVVGTESQTTSPDDIEVYT